MCHCGLSHVWVTESSSAEMPATAPAAHGDFQVTHTCVKLGDSEVTVAWESDECCSDQSWWQADISLGWSDEAQFCLLQCHCEPTWQVYSVTKFLFGDCSLRVVCRAWKSSPALTMLASLPGGATWHPAIKPRHLECPQKHRSEPCLLPGPSPDPDVIRTSHCDHPSHPTQWGWCPPLF